MLVHNIICKQQHRFEAWFRSYNDMQRQLKLSLVNCPVCNSTEVELQLANPKIIKSRSKHYEGEETLRSLIESQDSQISDEWGEGNKSKNLPQDNGVSTAIREFFTRNFIDVGKNFCKEIQLTLQKSPKAQLLKEENKKKLGIRGIASPKEIKNLQEDLKIIEKSNPHRIEH